MWLPLSSLGVNKILQLWVRVSVSLSSIFILVSAVACNISLVSNKQSVVSWLAMVAEKCRFVFM